MAIGVLNNGQLPRFRSAYDIGGEIGESIGTIAGAVGKGFAERKTEQNKAKANELIMQYDNRSGAFQGLDDVPATKKLASLLMPLDETLAQRYMVRANELEDRSAKFGQEKALAEMRIGDTREQDRTTFTQMTTLHRLLMGQMYGSGWTNLTPDEQKDIKQKVANVESELAKSPEGKAYLGLGNVPQAQEVAPVADSQAMEAKLKTSAIDKENDGIIDNSAELFRMVDQWAKDNGKRPNDPEVESLKEYIRNLSTTKQATAEKRVEASGRVKEDQRAIANQQKPLADALQEMSQKIQASKSLFKSNIKNGASAIVAKLLQGDVLAEAEFARYGSAGSPFQLMLQNIKNKMTGLPQNVDISVVVGLLNSAVDVYNQQRMAYENAMGDNPFKNKALPNIAPISFEGKDLKPQGAQRRKATLEDF